MLIAIASDDTTPKVLSFIKTFLPTSGPDWRWLITSIRREQPDKRRSSGFFAWEFADGRKAPLSHWLLD
jgi:hypothetical protein